jgi:hypothetical protein
MRAGIGCLLMVVALIMLIAVLGIVGAIAVPSFLDAQTGSHVVRHTMGPEILGVHGGMTGLGILAVVGSLLPFLFLLGVVFVVVRLARSDNRGSCSERGGERTAQDDHTIQDLHHGFTEMEKRIESLETILIEKTRRP